MRPKFALCWLTETVCRRSITDPPLHANLIGTQNVSSPHGRSFVLAAHGGFVVHSKNNLR
jgi:hypothetical protein